MAQIVPLKCPSCGAPLNRDSSRCEFCGTELLLIQNGSGFQTKTANSCVRCGNPLGNGAWLCPKCGTPIPGNEDRLRELQLKQRYLQNDLKKNVPQLATALEPDEFIEYCYWGRFGYFAVTEKRLLVYAKRGMFGDKILDEYKWGEVAAVGDVVFDRAVKVYLMEVQTLKGNRRLGFNLDGQAAHRFRREIGAAVTRHNTRQREIRALIWSLDLNGKAAG